MDHYYININGSHALVFKTDELERSKLNELIEWLEQRKATNIKAHYLGATFAKKAKIAKLYMALCITFDSPDPQAQAKLSELYPAPKHPKLDWEFAVDAFDPEGIYAEACA